MSGGLTVTDAVEIVFDGKARIGEGPVWDARDGLLLWVDIERGELHRLDPLTARHERFDVGGQLGAAVLREKGGYVLARENGYYAYEAGGKPELLAYVEADDPSTRINDARCDAAGRIWGGTLEEHLAPGRGALYCLEPDTTVRRVLTRVTVSNGLDWSPEGDTMYYVDSHAYSVQAFDFDLETGTISRPRSLVEYPRLPWVFPDGMTVDVDGFLWVAIFGAGVVNRYSPDGRLDRILKVPTRLVTSCGFGGVNLDELYITTATHVLLPEEAGQQSYPGGLFRHRPGVRGLPQHAFLG